MRAGRRSTGARCGELGQTIVHDKKPLAAADA